MFRYRVFTLVTLSVAIGCAASAGPLAAQERRPQTIATVVKITGIPWFDRMKEGVDEFARSSKVVTRLAGPTEAVADEQLRVIEELIAEKDIDALVIVPTDPGAIEAVSRRALQRGMVVVTHEADNQVHTMADLEAVDNVAFGTALNERMAACMGYRGKWASFVGTRRSRTHLLWIEAGTANAAKHPGMEMVSSPNESNDDAEQAYRKAKEILRQHPDIKGFQGSASSDVIGIGRAIEEAGLQATTCVYGTGLPSRAGKLLESGAVKGIGFWDPRHAGMAANRVAKLLLDRKPITDGMNLGVVGYEEVTVKRGAGGGFLIIGKADVIVDKAGYKAYPF
ncbi:substrate-binding domain-containing protein [Piscinibacter sp. XHJ-5]|uniref:substrate-binding domain-containing protein n=1 Tax=Piscinibacter sp. XHJ-5 TaxID=3037797 RepID=UPI002452819C|nr:substrate-binding domain-containing protein [Piscinibacter sp. XHJ-5]